MLRIAIDMDDVIADTLARHLALYNAEFGESLTRDELCGRHLHEAVPSPRRDRFEEYLLDPHFFADIPVVAESARVIQRLREHFEVFIATAAMDYPASLNAKYTWLRSHFPFIPSKRLVFCGDKSILRADYLIDDNVWQLERFQGEGILFTAPHNTGVTGYRRVHNWLDIEQLFLANLPSAPR